MKYSLYIAVIVLGFVLNTSIAGTVNSFDMVNGDQTEVTLYPNPVSDGTLMVTAEKEMKKLEILNIVGEKVLSDVEPEPVTSVRLDVNILKSGIYLIKITFTDNTSNTKRIWVK